MKKFIKKPTSMFDILIVDFEVKRRSSEFSAGCDGRTMTGRRSGLLVELVSLVLDLKKSDGRPCWHCPSKLKAPKELLMKRVDGS